MRAAAKSLLPRSPLACALAAAAAFLLWQALAVHFLYGGHWTALFYTGDRASLPPALAGRTYLWPQSDGYDGQYYRLVAHAPLLQRETVAALGSEGWRYRRILVPALSWLLAAGRPGLIDSCYIAVVAAFVFAGVWWLAAYAKLGGAPAAWGLLVLAVPATLISMQRLTIDVALVSLCAGLVYYQQRGSAGGIAAVLAAACLVRETGALLVAAACVHALLGRRRLRVLLFAACALPALAWNLFVAARLTALQQYSAAPLAVPAWMFREPVIGIVRAIFHPPTYPYPRWKEAVAQAADSLALVGVLLALALAVTWRPGKRTMLAWAAAVLFAGLTVALSAPGVWVDINGWARPISPLYLFLALRTLSEGRWWTLSPLLLADLRLGLQLQAEPVGVIRALLSG
ncbi:MAG: hypothetical protein AAB225_12780 [Acidobacteriota bacterium]